MSEQRPRFILTGSAKNQCGMSVPSDGLGLAKSHADFTTVWYGGDFLLIWECSFSQTTLPGNQRTRDRWMKRIAADDKEAHRQCLVRL